MFSKASKDHTSPLNYRPLSLLNFYFEKNELPTSGTESYQKRPIWKRGHSTTYALLRNVERITHGFNNHTGTVTLFLDIEQAFDKVWITGLIAKHTKAKIPPT
jgi:hypothetical protein